MKKSSELRIVTILKSIFNIRWWIDYDRLKSFTLYLWNGFKKMFVPQPQPTSSSEADESFKQVLKELNISEKELLAREKGLFRLSIVMCLVAVFMLGYAGYHVYYASIKAVVISLVVMLIALVLAFRYHFWYFQIKRRKLGCSFKEWYRQGLLGEKR